ncbi:MAG TPA: LysM peptidoglycan-binding domain-containing protein [Chromatiales bacterium]|nr:LysM peptidoglycan-binding domain-containing protein [Chromatiales bacterium]
MRPATRLLVVGFLLALSGCSGPAVRFVPENGMHVVRPGETLYSIARAYDLDWRQVATRNGIRSPYTIQVGQRLRLTGAPSKAARTAAASPPPSVVQTAPRKVVPKAARMASPAHPPRVIAWAWPTRGRVVSRFLDGHATRKGIDIAGTVGQPVRAAAAGEVVYSGSGLSGYGKLVIVKHDARFLTAYAYNKDLLVREGEPVQSGQVIARMGMAEADKPMLHFEIRLDGNPVDPLRFLPQGG